MTTFGGTKLSEEAEESMFGDITDEGTIRLPDPPPPLDSAPEPDAAEEPSGEPEPEALNPPEGSEPVVEEEVPAAVLEGEEPASGEAPSPPEDDWKKRYDDIRSQQMKALERERERAELAEQQLAQLLSSQSEAQISPERIAELTRRAEEMGLDPAQVGLYADITSEAVDSRSKAVVEALSQQAQAARAQAQAAQAAAEQELVDSFRAAHPDLDVPKQQEVARFLHDIGAAYFVDQEGNELPQEVPYEQKVASGILQSVEPLTADVLEVAYQAVTDPNLGKVLRAMPALYESDEGLEMAARLASQVGPEVTTQPKSVDSAAVDKALAAAETLSGTSAPAPVEEEPLLNLPRDVFFSK